MNLKNAIYKIKKELEISKHTYSEMHFNYYGSNKLIYKKEGYITALEKVISILSEVKEPVETGVEQIIKECKRKIEQKDYFLKNLNFHKLNKLKIYTILLAEKCAFQYMLEYIDKEVKEKKNDKYI